MRKLRPIVAAALLLASACAAPVAETPPASRAPAPAAANPIVGGAAMDPQRSIVQNMAASQDHTTLVSALRAAGLEGTLSAGGPYTLFAPTNDAFRRLPSGTIDTLMAPANRTLLAQLLNYHVVPGSKTRAQIAADIRAGGGTASYRTAQGEFIRVTMEGQALAVTDRHGNRTLVSTGDVIQANGVVHVLGGVLLPST